MTVNGRSETGGSGFLRRRRTISQDPVAQFVFGASDPVRKREFVLTDVRTSGSEGNSILAQRTTPIHCRYYAHSGVEVQGQPPYRD